MIVHTDYLLFNTKKRQEFTAGRLNLGPWEQIFYAEFDGRRKKRVVVEVMGI